MSSSHLLSASTAVNLSLPTTTSSTKPGAHLWAVEYLDSRLKKNPRLGLKSLEKILIFWRNNSLKKKK